MAGSLKVLAGCWKQSAKSVREALLFPVKIAPNVATVIAVENQGVVAAEKPHIPQHAEFTLQDDRGKQSADAQHQALGLPHTGTGR